MDTTSVLEHNYSWGWDLGSHSNSRLWGHQNTWWDLPPSLHLRSFNFLSAMQTSVRGGKTSSMQCRNPEVTWDIFIKMLHLTKRFSAEYETKKQRPHESYKARCLTAKTKKPQEFISSFKFVLLFALNSTTTLKWLSIHWGYIHCRHDQGVLRYLLTRGSVVGWDTVLQAGRSRVQVRIMSLIFCHSLHNPSSRTIPGG
jgi:hypothetical protein